MRFCCCFLLVKFSSCCRWFRHGKIVPIVLMPVDQPWRIKLSLAGRKPRIIPAILHWDISCTDAMHLRTTGCPECLLDCLISTFCEYGEKHTVDSHFYLYHLVAICHGMLIRIIVCEPIPTGHIYLITSLELKFCLIALGHTSNFQWWY